jgi:CubicO group peptidase (beta-lactamase class C family)
MIHGMKRVACFVFLAILCACNGQISETNPIQNIPLSGPPILVNGTMGEHLDRTIRDHYSDFSGTILIAQHGKILLIKGYGLADLEKSIPNNPQTQFAIGSITKSFTAMAIMILKDRRLLTLQDPICQYLVDCPAAWEPVTLQQLLTHTSGIFDLALNPDFQSMSTCQVHKPEELMALYKDHALDFPPGSQFHYSNSGYQLLGMVIAKVSGQGYNDFIQENILDPLGMADTGNNSASHPLSNRATGYSQDSWAREKVKAPCYDSSMFFADGGLYSTVEDLYKWDQALYTNRLVSKESLSQIFASTVTVVASPGFTVPPGLWYYGYGWMITQQFGHRLIEHGGRIPGYTAYLARYPDDQLTIIILSNWDRLNPIGLNDELAAMILERK